MSHSIHQGRAGESEGEVGRQHRAHMERRARLWDAAPLRKEPPIVGFAAPVSLIGRPSYRTIITLVALRCQVPTRELFAPGRHRPAASARQMAAALIYNHTEMSLSEVGDLFGRDHSMVATGLRKFGRARRGQ